MKLKVYADLVTGTFYMTGFTFLTTGETLDESFDRMEKAFAAKDFDKRNRKKITKNGSDGMEMTFVKDNVYFRMQVFPSQDKIFLLMAGSERKDGLFTSEIERFLSSFTMNQTVTAKPNTWMQVRDTLKGFDISFPGKPAIDPENQV